MKTHLRILAACALAAVSLAGVAQPKPLFPASRGIKATPIRVARAICTIDKNGKRVPKVVGNWMPYVDNQLHIALDTTLAYDEYELADPTGVLGDPGNNPTYTGCGFDPGARYTNGPNQRYGWQYNDMATVPGAAGALSSRALVGFYSDVDTQAGTDHDFQFFLFTTENFPMTAGAGTGANDASAAGRGDYPGWVFSFGNLPKSDPFYYWSDLDLTTVAGTWQLPTDGTGGILSVFGDVTLSANTIAFVGNHALWGDVPGNPTPAEDVHQWDDDTPADLLFVDSELYDYSNPTSCPLVLGMMVAFMYTPAASETLAPTSETIQLGKGTAGDLASWAADDGNARRICKFLVPNLFSPFIRVNLNYTTTKPLPTAIDFIIKAKMVNAGVFKIRGFIQNKVSSAFVQVLADSTINLTYATYTGSATGVLAEFVGAAGAMTGRIEIQQTGISAVVFPCTDFEFANMKVTG